MRGEKIYEYEVEITGAVDFGVTLEAILTGQAAIPPSGARFDFGFAGRAEGRLSGKLTGTDYYRLRPDGRGELNIRGVIETDDGARISMEATGVATPTATGMDLVENVQLTTASPDYAWVNTRQIWAEGASADGKIRITGWLQ